MRIINNHEYRKITKIHYNNKSFQIFLDDYDKLAVLEIDKNNTLIYPNIKDVFCISKILCNSPRDILSSKEENKNKIKKYKFIPKVVINGSVVLLNTLLLSGCIPKPYKPEITELHFAPSQPLQISTQENDNNTNNYDEVYKNKGSKLTNTTSNSTSCFTCIYKMTKCFNKCLWK